MSKPTSATSRVRHASQACLAVLQTAVQQQQLRWPFLAPLPTLSTELCSRTWTRHGRCSGLQQVSATSGLRQGCEDAVAVPDVTHLNISNPGQRVWLIVVHMRTSTVLTGLVE